MIPRNCPRMPPSGSLPLTASIRTLLVLLCSEIEEDEMWRLSPASTCSCQDSCTCPCQPGDTSVTSHLSHRPPTIRILMRIRCCALTPPPPLYHQPK